MKTKAGYNPNGKNKKVARKYMVAGVADSTIKNSKKLILSLPHIHWQIEQRILRTVSRKFSFVAVERDEKTFQLMAKYALENSLWNGNTLHHGSLGDQIFNRTEGTYSHIIADYCGQLHTVADELQYAIENKIVEKGGTIAITLNLRGSGDFKAFAEELTGKKFVSCENTLAMFIKKYAKDNYRTIKTFKYSDNEGKVNEVGSKMILVIIKRVK